MKTKLIIIIISFFMLVVNAIAAQKTRIGIIGLDTSHAPAFVKLINSENPKPEFADFKVVVAYPHGSKTIESSFKRIPGFTDEVKKYGVRIVDSIEDLLDQVDCVLLVTNDGNLHLGQAAKVIKAGKIVFIDKPIGANLAQSIAIYELAKQYNVPVFSSSTLRFVKHNQAIAKGESGVILGADCYSPAVIEPSHADFAWYGIHGVETLFTVMGSGCASVSRTTSEGADVAVGLWEDGRIGTFRGIRTGKHIYGGTAFTNKGAIEIKGHEGYEMLLKEIVQFFKTKVSPVSEAETLEIFTFIEAADLSKKNNGKTISMSKTFIQGQKDAKKLLKKLN